MRHILVVDDEQGIRQIVCDFLENQGVRATSCGGVREAIQQLRQESYDFVLTDYHMDDGTGQHVIEAARAHCPGIRCGLMTGDIASVPVVVLEVVDHLIHKPQILAPLGAILSQLGVQALRAPI